MSNSTSSSVPSTPVSKNVAVTHIVVLLDESGSMESIRGDVIGGFNRLIGDQRNDGPDAKVTLVKFDSQDPHNVVCETVQRTKGLEYDAVILATTSTTVRDSLLYVGASRAVSLLTVIAPVEIGQKLGLTE